MPTTVIHVRDADFTDPNTVYIGWEMPRRGLKRSFWANPFHIGKDGSRAEVISAYRRLLLEGTVRMERLPELRGKTLACWCVPEACHGDVLAEMADAEMVEVSVRGR